MRLGLVCFFAFLFVEIYSIIRVSEYVGFLATLVLLISGVIFGLKLMRSQGITSRMKLAQSNSAGESVLVSLAQGMVRALSGILLIFPGFFSDLLALILLLPFVHGAFARYIHKKGKFAGLAQGGFSGSFNPFTSPGANDEGKVYEHEGVVEKNDAKSNSGESGGRIIEHNSKLPPF